jgi:hypothetical protein
LLVTLGLIDGFADRRGDLPRFHGLGAGAPIALPLLALAAYGSPLLSVDSTAPEKNASMGKLFVNKPAPMTVSVAGVAQALIDERQAWDCPCPFCRQLQIDLPFDLTAARAFYRDRIAPRAIEDHDLESDDGIGRYLSFCWEPRTGSIRKLIARARTNHSHWAIAGISQAIRAHLGSYEELRGWVGDQCAAYCETTTPVYAVQMQECLRLIDRLRPREIQSARLARVAA